MEQNTLIKLLLSLSREETKKLRKFLVSPYFNNKKFILKFYDEIMTYYPNFTSSNFSMDIIKTEIKIKENTFRSLQSKLVKSIYEFLVFENISKNKFNKVNCLCSELLFRNLFDIFQKRVKRFEEHELPNIKQDSFYFYNLFLLKSYKANNDILSKIISSKKNKAIDVLNYIDNCYHYILVFAISLVISDYIKYIIINLDYGVDIDKTLLGEIVGKIDFKNISQLLEDEKEIFNYFAIYYKLLKSFVDFSNGKKYLDYKKSVFKNIKLMNEDERNFHISNLINLCLLPKRSSETDKFFTKNVFELYKIMLNKEYYKDTKNKYLPIQLFRNILITSTKLKKYTWAIQFINIYSRKVSPDQTKNVYNYGLAYLYNAKQDYEKSIKYLHQIKIDRFIYKFDVRDMNLKMFYEIGEYEKVIELIHNYKDFLRNNKFSTKDRRLFRGNFIKFLEKLVIIKCGSKILDAGYLRKLIIQAKHVSNRNWLIEKVDRII